MRWDSLRGHAAALGFTPADQVRWLSPRELWRTAVQVGLFSVFSHYADNREIQAGLQAERITVAPDPDGGIWFDFVADLGDGFDATATVAALVAQSRLDVADVASPGSTSRDLPRGRVLVLGGDEVYPTPSATAYEDRTKGPYRNAFPESALDAGGGAPLMVALPGNHDWYDGLTAFLRVFTQGRTIGGWQTAQHRSYFVVELPQRWWLVGLDTQLGTDIDDPQVLYFRQTLCPNLRPGDGVIVCSATPTWVHTGYDGPDAADAFNSLHWFERHVVRRRLDDHGVEQDSGARVRVWLTGDLHHYARYEEQGTSAPGEARQFLTCGLGGAFLSGTHTLPQHLTLPPATSKLRNRDDPVGYGLAGCWPSRDRSKALSRGVLSIGPRGLPWRNPGFWPLAGGVHIAAFVVLLALLSAETLRWPAPALREAGAVDILRLAGLVGIWALAAMVVTAFTRLRGRRRLRPSLTALAAAMQAVVAFLGLLGLAVLPWPGWAKGWLLLACALLLTAAVTGLVGSYAFALFLMLPSRGLVAEWQMSAQSIEDSKGFLRLRIDPHGRLTIHPVVVDEVCRDWRTVPGDAAGTERAVPTGDLPRPYLAEPPIVVTRRPTP
jgi:hypothetical protein